MSAHTEVTGTEDVLDSRDILSRYRYLSSPLDSDEADETEFERECIETWLHNAPWPVHVLEQGVVLVADHHMSEYAGDYAENTGELAHDSWVSRYVDWDAAAQAMKQDMISCTLFGHTFWGRS